MNDCEDSYSTKYIRDGCEKDIVSGLMNFCNKSHDIRSKDYNVVKAYVHKKLIKAALHYRLQQKQVKDV